MVIWCSGGKTFKTRRQHRSDVLRGVWLVLASAAQLRDLFGALSAPARFTCLSHVLTGSWWDRGGQREERLTCVLHVPTMPAGGHRLCIQPREVGSTSGPHSSHQEFLHPCFPSLLPKAVFCLSRKKKNTIVLRFLL